SAAEFCIDRLLWEVWLILWFEAAVEVVKGFGDSGLRLGKWFKVAVDGSNQFGRAAARSAKDVVAEFFIENSNFATKDPTTI
ncbi:hypothetical protein B296_00042208, partial [Ensete ventricosum]